MKKLLVSNKYASPRWSQELPDCSMPMTIDTYSACSFKCIYCFSFYQKANGKSRKKYLSDRIDSIDVERVKGIFAGKEHSTKSDSGFSEFVASRRAVQWGGLADQFDDYEREFGVSLELLKFFREQKYPVSMSTKGVWWTEDERYTDLICGAKHFHFKISIITGDEEKARRIEIGCPTPAERLKAIGRLSKMGVGGVTLRLRPFIVGISTPTYLDLIKKAHDAGADSVSTEFLCVELRSRLARSRFELIGKIAGYDLVKMYQKHSPGQTGYLRLGQAVKKPYMEKMAELCDKLGMRFYVSDAHFKELCHHGSCCGIPVDWKYTKGQFTEALLLAKKNGTVRWSEIESELDYADGFLWRAAEGFNSNSAEKRASFHDWTMKKWIRYLWNNVKSGKGPYKYFGGVMKPVDRDENGDLIYKYEGRK